MGVSRRGFLKVAGVAAGTFALSGCGGPSDADKPVYVGIVNGKPEESGYRAATDKSMHEALDQRDGIAPEYAYETKSADQTVSARELVQKGVKYLLVSAASNEGWEATLKDAYDAGTLTILFDRPLDVEEGAYAAAVVADAGAEARDAVAWLAARGLGRCDIIHIQGVPDSASLNAHAAALDEVVAAHDGWSIVAREPASGNAVTAQEITQAVIDAGTPFNVIYAESDEMARGAVVALDSSGITHGRDGDVVVMAFDHNTWALEEVLAGNWNFDGWRDPAQGPAVADLLSLFEAGEEPAEKTVVLEHGWVDCDTITQDYVDERGLQRDE